MIKDIELLKNLDILYKNKIFLYGAGAVGGRAIRLLEEIGLEVEGVCESNSKRWGTSYLGCKVISMGELKESCQLLGGIIIITSEGNEDEIADGLNYYKIDADIYTYFGLRTSVEVNIEDSRIPTKYREKIEVIASVYDRNLVNRTLVSKKMFDAVKGDDVVLVYQPGKVGSSTVLKSLRKRRINTTHCHFLGGSWRLRDLGEDIIREKENYSRLLNILKKVKIITLVREPIMRDISNYFQRFEENILSGALPDTYQGVLKYLDEYSDMGEFGYQFEWHRMELESVTGIDIYQYPFNREKGYTIIKEGNLEVLVLKLEALNNNDKLIGEFLSVKDFKIYQDNLGDKKPYRYVYKELKKNLKIPTYIVERYYSNNSRMDHFYTEEEKKKFLEKMSIIDKTYQ